MKKIQKKIQIITFAIILILALSTFLIILPNTIAQEPKVKTYPFINAVPNPVGINQEVLLHVGITDGTSYPQEGWTGLEVIVRKPDGTTETLGPFMTDTTGGTGGIFVPTMVGTYTLQTHFPEQEAEAALRFPRPLPAGTIMEESITEELELEVQEDPIEYYPAQPLPTEYWSRPIDAQLREWYTISASWLMPGWAYPPRGFYAPYNEQAPEGPHVLWAKELMMGGIGGGALGEPSDEALGYHAYDIGDAYEGHFPGPIIIAKTLLYTRWIPRFRTSNISLRRYTHRRRIMVQNFSQ
jgi:hypothetical protein